MLDRLQHRDHTLRSVSQACKLVSDRVESPEWKEFRLQVVSAVSEAFNNIVLHGYEGREDGVIEVEIRTGPDHIDVELRDWGASFDPNKIPQPDFDSLPESGLGMYIIRAFMSMRYHPGKKGRPNVLVLSKALEGPAPSRGKT